MIEITDPRSYLASFAGKEQAALKEAIETRKLEVSWRSIFIGAVLLTKREVRSGHASSRVSGQEATTVLRYSGARNRARVFGDNICRKKLFDARHSA